MFSNNLTRAAMLMVFLVIVIIGGWEIHLRMRGLPISYDNGPELWANSRAKVYEPAAKTTVFIGSSRIKYDLDIATWRQLTGRNAVQLSMEGSSPLPCLIDLGNDTAFRGRLVVDVTEFLFFSLAPNALAKPEKAVAYYHSRTPAQKASFVLDHTLESGFVFLDRDFLSVEELLERMDIPNRKGIDLPPNYPLEFSRTDFDRQNKMMDKFLTDTTLQNTMKGAWVWAMEMGKKAPPPKENPIPGLMKTVKEAVDKIRARGGDVTFIRTPSSGMMYGVESHVFPKEGLWAGLLAGTHSRGFYFTEDSATAHFICPEWSHLRPTDAVLYTQALVKDLPKNFVDLN